MKKAKAALAIILSTSLLFGCSQKSEEVKKVRMKIKKFRIVC